MIKTAQVFCFFFAVKNKRKLKIKDGKSVCVDGPGRLLKLKEKEKVNKLKGGLWKVAWEDEPGRTGGRATRLTGKSSY